MTKRQRCFMEIEVGGVAMGKITMELFTDKCPRTCENFRALCTGEKGIGKTTEKPLHYLTSIFHRVVNGFMIQGGDFSNGNGTGGESIYGGVFPDEDLMTKHDVPFLLSMANRGKDTNGSQFFITTNVTPHLDGIHVVFGEIKSGEDIVKYIEGLPVDRMCRPMQDVKITRCGELVLKSKASKKASKKKKRRRSYVSSSESPSSDSEDEQLAAKSPRKMPSQDKPVKPDKISESSGKKTSVDGDIDELEVHPLVTISKIDPDDIPEIPSNKFLLRGGPDVEKSRSTGSSQNQRTNSSSSYNQRRSSRYGMVTKSGRHIKGRGKFRFRTPSPSDQRSRERSRSATPPHWRQAQKNTIKMSEYKKVQVERSNREKDRTVPGVNNPNGTENGSARDLKEKNSSEKREKTVDEKIKEKSKVSDVPPLKQSVELVFVKATGEDQQKPEEILPAKPKEKLESPQNKKTENIRNTEEKKGVKVRNKPEEEIIMGQVLDLNALDYEVTEFDQAESEHSNENENDDEDEKEKEKEEETNEEKDKDDDEVEGKEEKKGVKVNEIEKQKEEKMEDDNEDENETEKCAEDKDVSIEAGAPSAPVNDDQPKEPPLKTAPPAEKPAEKPDGKPTEKPADSTKPDGDDTKPLDRDSSRKDSSKQPPSKQPSSRRPRRDSSSSDKRRRSERKSSRRDSDRKHDRHESRRDRRRRSRSPERRSNGAPSRRRRSRSSSSSNPSPRRHRTRR